MDWAGNATVKHEFDRFTAEVSDLLLRTGYLMTGDAKDAEDLAQETLLRVARRWTRVRSMDRPAAYARRILINLTIDPSAIPAGTELSVGDFQLSSGQYSGSQQADFVLIDTNSYTCGNTPPDPNGMPAGYGENDGIGLLYGGPGPSSGS
jgi:hypothetical protein